MNLDVKNFDNETIIGLDAKDGYAVFQKDEFVVKDSGKREEFITGSKRDTRDGKGRFDLLPWEAIRRWAVLLEKGAIKYGERNWELGQPTARYFDSAIRHLYNWYSGERTEDHLAAALFNVGAIIFTETAIKAGKLPKELDSLGHTND